MELKSVFVKCAKDFQLKLDSSLKKCLRSEPNMRFRKNYLTELLQKTLLRCDVKSSKVLTHFQWNFSFVVVCQTLVHWGEVAGTNIKIIKW